MNDDRNPERYKFPKVQGQCPACGYDSLFLGNGGYVTCAILECKDPGAADDVLVKRDTRPTITLDDISPATQMVAFMANTIASEGRIVEPNTTALCVSELHRIIQQLKGES